MIWLATAARFVGVRGAVGVAVGAALVTAPAYQLGRWTEGAAARERLGRVLAEDQLRRTEVDNARVDAAVAARLAVDGDPRGGGLSDDGFRRD